VSENKIYLELTPEEFVVIMSALDYVSGEVEIRTMYTDGDKSSKLSTRAGEVYGDLYDEGFEAIYDEYIERRYSA
jgi:hypothetical protein